MSSNTCFHCGLPNPANPFSLSIDGKNREFCCTGCQSAAKAIIDAGLGEYYKFYKPDQHPVDLAINKDVSASFEFYDRGDIQSDFVQNKEGDQSFCILLIEGISCSACTWLIEKRLQQLPGVIAASVNASTHRLSVTWHSDSTKLSEIFKSLYLIGYQASPFLPDQEEQVRQRTQRKYILRLGIAGIGMMQAMMNAVALYSGAIDDKHEIWLWWTSLFLTLPVIFVSAWPFFTSAWHSVRSKHLSMDVSVSVAILSAFLASVYATLSGHGEVYYESVNMFTFFLVLSRFLEFRARSMAHMQGNAAHSALPQVCHLLSEGNVDTVPIKDLKSGDIIRVLPGETCPIDGIVENGSSEFDESSFTGEFKGVFKRLGDQVSAGTINQHQPIEIRVADNQRHSFNFLQSLIEKASSEKSRLAELADRGARQFIWSTLVISALIGLVWLWIDPDRAFWIVISVLVVTCPCALSLATPTALAQATLSLKRNGFIITRGYAFERLTQITEFAFDKTGTLTEGRFSIHSVDLVDTAGDAKFTVDEILTISACLEQKSEHAIASAFSEIPIPADNLNFEEFENHPGRGVSGTNPVGTWFLGQDTSADNDTCTTILLSLDHQPIARILLIDQVRSTTSALFSELKKRDIKSHILTGDSNASLGSEFVLRGLSGEYVSGCTAEDKVEWVQSHTKSDSLAVVGDGLNDAPLLAAAPLSIAMMNATDMTKSQADVLMLTTDLQVIHTAIEMAHKTKRIIRQNLAWALVYNAIALPLAAMGWVTPWQAAIGMSASSLLVVGNALRLRKV